MKRFFYLLPAFAVAATLYFLHSQQEAEEANSGKLAFSIDAEAFYNALLKARDKALCVELGSDRWAITQDGQTLRLLGGWQHGARLGTNVPGGWIHFDISGACRTGQGGTCEGFEITIASDVNRIYTITFDSTGKPVIEYDDF